MSCFNHCGNDRRHNSLFCSDDCAIDHFREHNRKKSKRFWKNHKEIVKWGDDYIAEKFAGTLVEVTYSQVSGEGTTMDFKNTNNKLTSNDYESFILEIDKILMCYFIDSEIFLPMTIRVDDEGKCHLLMFNSNTGIHTTNKILRHGKVEIVDKDYRKDW